MCPTPKESLRGVTYLSWFGLPLGQTYLFNFNLTAGGGVGHQPKESKERLSLLSYNLFKGRKVKGHPLEEGKLYLFKSLGVPSLSCLEVLLYMTVGIRIYNLRFGAI